MAFHNTSLLLRKHVKTDVIGVQTEYRRWKCDGLLGIRTEITAIQILQRYIKFPIYDLCKEYMS